MLELILVILVVLWLTGQVSGRRADFGGDWFHVLLVIVVLLVILRLLRLI